MLPTTPHGFVVEPYRTRAEFLGEGKPCFDRQIIGSHLPSRLTRTSHICPWGVWDSDKPWLKGMDQYA